MDGRLTITDVAKKVGVTPKTLVRWEKAGKIQKPKRDWKGWRLYLEEDVNEIKRIINTVYTAEELFAERSLMPDALKVEG